MDHAERVLNWLENNRRRLRLLVGAAVSHRGPYEYQYEGGLLCLSTDIIDDHIKRAVGMEFASINAVQDKKFGPRILWEIYEAREWAFDLYERGLLDGVIINTGHKKYCGSYLGIKRFGFASYRDECAVVSPHYITIWDTDEKWAEHYKPGGKALHQAGMHAWAMWVPRGIHQDDNLFSIWAMTAALGHVTLGPESWRAAGQQILQFRLYCIKWVTPYVKWIARRLEKKYGIEAKVYELRYSKRSRLPLLYGHISNQLRQDIEAAKKACIRYAEGCYQLIVKHNSGVTPYTLPARVTHLLGSNPQEEVRRFARLGIELEIRED